MSKSYASMHVVDFKSTTCMHVVDFFHHRKSYRKSYVDVNLPRACTWWIFMLEYDLDIVLTLVCGNLVE